MTDRGRIVVWGMLGAHPYGGMTWQVLHYVEGLRRLGFDVWYVEDSDRPLHDPVDLAPTLDYRRNVEFVADQMKGIGLEDRWVFRAPGVRDRCHGATDLDGLARLYREADAVINLCGCQELREEHRGIRCLVYLQTDPLVDQVKLVRGEAAKCREIEAYHHLFTYAECIGSPGCLVPETGHLWHVTRPPVCMDWWESDGPPPPDARITTITGWRRYPDKDLEWNGRRWSWNKQDRMRCFLDLPSRSALPLEAAISAIGAEDQAMLREHGWRVVQGSNLAAPSVYRDYVVKSLAEFTVAKEQYVDSRSGWFSDRSVCYLAAGRPVITPETGFSDHVPIGAGLFAYDGADDVVAAIEELRIDWPRHSAAAREVAGECFAAERVLADMAREIGLL